MKWAALLVALAACGDNALPDGTPLAPSHDVVIVAHQDDDLLFVQPDVLDAVRAGTGVTAVYVTAGNGLKGADFAQQRYAGLRDAYGAAAGDTRWSCGWIELSGHTAEHCRLDAANVSLVFLGYPDGGKQGEYAHSLLKLWEGTIAGADTVAERSTHYDRESLIDTVAEVLRLVQPKRIHTLEIAATHGYDHSDHMIVGAIALLATARADSNAELISYRGYNMACEPVDKPDPLYAEQQQVFAYYEACYTGCAPCGEACPADKIDPTHVVWLHRRYAVGFVRAARGLVRGNGGCLGFAAGATTGVAAVVDCSGAPVWNLDAGGELHDDHDRCLVVADGGAIVAGACTGGADHRVFADDEGHLWTGVPPAPAAGMEYAHLACLAPADNGSVSAVLCGADLAPTWRFVPAVVVTDRGGTGLTASGRALRIGDLTGDGRGDLCAIEPGGLMCAPGDGTGAFGAARRIDMPGQPLAIVPRSLAIGDVDGDGRDDACGIASDGSGIACATAAAGFAAMAWSSELGSAESVAGTPESFAIAHEGHAALLCGLSTQGLLCVVSATSFNPLKLSTWPAPDAVVWPGELDGDGHVDWCSASASGAACALAADSIVTTDGAPWSFAYLGVFDPAPTADTGGLADIDGDGRADLCDVDGDGVHCARNQGRGFGPRALVVPGVAGASLTLGDLDGNGRADPCVATVDSITCALSP
ncbi:MAG: FG-GAP-like repeat-containing protein [Acidobacteriota bacterium]